MNKYRVNPVKEGRKTKFQIQKRVFLFLWQTVMNPLIVNMQSPFEYRSEKEALDKLSTLK